MALKAGQKLTHGRRPQLGAAGAAGLVVAHWRATPSACEALYDMPMLNRSWIEGLVRGRRDAPPTTVAFLVNLLAAVVPRDTSYDSLRGVVSGDVRRGAD
jgi:asparagine synthase (glutamine-hydrolysing)